MLKMLFSPMAAEWSSAALVFLSGAVVGHQAQFGLSPAQWTGGAAAILGSIALAVMVRAWPAPSRRRIGGARGR
jgi:hypothetical protein